MKDEPQDGPKEPKTESFKLKQVETQVLTIMQNNQQASFAAVLSMLATERLGYPVTARTQFKLDPSFSTIEITEAPEDVPVANTEEKPEEPKSPVVAA